MIAGIYLLAAVVALVAFYAAVEAFAAVLGFDRGATQVVQTLVSGLKSRWHERDRRQDDRPIEQRVWESWQ